MSLHKKERVFEEFKHTSERKLKGTPPKKLILAPIPTRKYRFKPGTVALRQIRHFQRTTELLIPRAALKRLVKEIIQDNKTCFNISKDAVTALHEASEDELVRFFKATQIAAFHGNRITVLQKDMELIRKLNYTKNEIRLENDVE